MTPSTPEPDLMALAEAWVKAAVDVASTPIEDRTEAESYRPRDEAAAAFCTALGLMLVVLVEKGRENERINKAWHEQATEDAKSILDLTARLDRLRKAGEPLRNPAIIAQLDAAADALKCMAIVRIATDIRELAAALTDTAPLTEKV